MPELKLGDIVVDVTLKDIRNVHLSVHPPTGRVRISAPERMTIETIRGFAISKLGWIREQQSKFREQEREPARVYVDRESHYLWGRRYLLAISERDQPPSVELTHSRIHLRARPGSSERTRAVLLEGWYRAQIRQAVPALLARWQPLMGVQAERVFVQRMKTRWGSCNHSARTIRLNTELARKPAECLEYIVVHELAHLLEATHNARFVALMNRHMPEWGFYRDLLNYLPVPHERWSSET